MLFAKDGNLERLGSGWSDGRGCQPKLRGDAKAG